MLRVLITSSPVTLPAILPQTLMMLPNTSASSPSSGETFRMVPTSFCSSSAILVAHLEIAVTACATTTGVPKPSEHTVSNTQEISLPTRSAMRSRTVSRTNVTTSPMIMTTVLIAPATVLAPARVSSCSAQEAR